MKKSQVELAFPLADLVKSKLSLHNSGNLTGKLIKTLKLGMGASMPVDGFIEGNVQEKYQCSTLNCQFQEQLAIVLRHDASGKQDVLWIYNSGEVTLTEHDLKEDDRYIDKRLKRHGVKFTRPHNEKKWVTA
jgi:hypothetical protein